LQKRFDVVPKEFSQRLRAVKDQAKLDRLFELAASCRNLEAFQAALDA